MRKLTPEQIEYFTVRKGWGVQAFQNVIGSWASVQFGHHIEDAEAFDAVYSHFQEQVTQLDDIIASADNDLIGERLADLFILSCTLCWIAGIDFADAIATKHQVNLHREWGEPNDRGIVHHVGHVERVP